MRHELSEDKSYVSVSIEVKDKDVSSPLYGQMELINTASGQVSSCQIIVESSDALKVYPRSLRFVKEEGGENLVGFFSAELL